MVLFFVVGLFYSLNPIRAQSPTIFTEIPQAKLQDISNHPTWLALLGYDDGHKSKYKSSDFFLSSTGDTNPYRELLSTLKAFRRKESENPNEHPQCKFPARFLWLKQHLPFKKMNLPSVECPKFEEFTSNGDVTSVSVVFVTGYLNNPASFYGHLLFKLNTSKQQSITDLEDISVNHGAIVPSGENVLLYIIKGIFGGYNAAFTHQSYYHHTHNYGEEELRNLWEYELNLSQKDTALLVAHIWEVIGEKHPYYFFDRNCAYQFGQLLEVILDRKFVSDKKIWITPQSIIQRLGEIRHEGKRLIKDVNFYPSRQTRFYQRFRHLSNGEKNLTKKVAYDTSALESREFSNLPTRSKQEITETLLDYYQYLMVTSDQDTTVYNKSYRQVLEKRYELPAGGTTNLFSDSYLQKYSPHRGRRPSYVSTHFFNNESLGEGIALQIRPAYYDSLDSSRGHKKNSSLAMGELILGVNNTKIWLKELNMLSIESLHKNITGLPGDRLLSWYLNIGFKQRKISCNDCLAGKINGGMGYTLDAFDNRVVLGTFVGAGFLGERFSNDQVYFSGRATLNINVSSRLRLRAEIEHREFLGNSNDEDPLKIEARIPLRSQSDLRFYFSKHLGEEIGISLGYYW